MTPKKQKCLVFLSDKMEVTALMVGKAITPDGWPEDSRRKSGAAVLGQLSYLGLVYRISELNAWRLTREGREKVKEYLNEK